MAIKNTVNNIKRKIILPLATTVVMSVNGGSANASPTKTKSQDAQKDNTELLTPDFENQYERKIQCNINKMVEKRADWLCQEYVSAVNYRLNAILNCANKTSYVKNLFDRMGHGKVYDKYCLVAQLASFKDVTDKTGNLRNVLPTSAECNDFMKGIRNRGYGDCLRQNPGFKNMRPGDIVFTPRGGGKYHATSVQKVWVDSKGIYHVQLNSFNRDRKYELQSGQRYIVLNMHKLVTRALWKEMSAKKIISPEILPKDAVYTLTLSEYNKISSYLTRGMPTTSVAENVAAPISEPKTKPKQPAMAVWAEKKENDRV